MCERDRWNSYQRSSTQCLIQFFPITCRILPPLLIPQSDTQARLCRESRGLGHRRPPWGEAKEIIVDHPWQTIKTHHTAPSPLQNATVYIKIEGRDLSPRRHSWKALLTACCKNSPDSIRKVFSLSLYVHIWYIYIYNSCLIYTLTCRYIK